MELNIQPFKEPRGFIKLMQWLFAICAFATTVDYSGRFGLTLQCSNGGESFRAIGTVKYPFNLDHQTFFYPKPPPPTPTGCQAPQELGLIGNAQSEATFFVFTGVISFLYATVMIGVYLLADKLYLENKRAALIDFFITIFLAVFWIAGASAWAHGVSTVSNAMDAKEWLGSMKTCTDYTCSDFFSGSVSKLVVSVLFGFINFVLWTGNIWFLYKETAYILNGVRFGNEGQNAQSPTSGGTA